MADDNTTVPSYLINVEAAESYGCSIRTLIAKRKCFTCKQADTELPLLDASPQEHITQIAKQCAATADYLLPDTPLMEAFFRVLLAAGNQHMTAEQISEYLAVQWAAAPYPRDISPGMISRLLETNNDYWITVYQE